MEEKNKNSAFAEAQLSVGDFIDASHKYIDTSIKMTQFLLIAAVAMGGWLVTSDHFLSSPPWSGVRIFWSAIYCAISGIFMRAILQSMIRANLCYKMIGKIFSAYKLNDDDLKGAFREHRVHYLYITMFIFICTVVLSILSYSSGDFVAPDFG